MCRLYLINIPWDSGGQHLAILQLAQTVATQMDDTEDIN